MHFEHVFYACNKPKGAAFLSRSSIDSSCLAAASGQCLVASSKSSQGSPNASSSGSASSDAPIAVCNHDFRVHNYMKPTNCAHCKTLLVGLLKQGYRCAGCGL